MAVQMCELSQLNIGFIGAGNMAQAIGIGLIKDVSPCQLNLTTPMFSDVEVPWYICSIYSSAKSYKLLFGTIDPSRVTVSAPSVNNFPQWTALGVTTTHSNADVVLRSDLIFLAVKPQMLNDALSDVKMNLTSGIDKSKLFVSLLAGTSLDSLYKKLKLIDPYCRVMRVMPNTALAVAAGVAAIAAHKESTYASDIKLIEKLFSSRGLCLTVPEQMITPIGALAGSGIAYVYLMMEALSDGGVKVGIPREKSTMLAAQTVLGASKMLLETEKHPAQLKDEVCSAGGTTIEGIHQLECGSFRGTVMSAVEAAAKKSEQLEKK